MEKPTEGRVLTVKDLDCFSCKVVGSGGTFAMGAYLIYATKIGQFRGGNRTYKFFLQAVGYGLFYMSAARWLYLPPFHKLLEMKKDK